MWNFAVVLFSSPCAWAPGQTNVLILYPTNFTLTGSNQEANEMIWIIKESAMLSVCAHGERLSESPDGNGYTL